jgi:hypothetical protein
MTSNKIRILLLAVASVLCAGGLVLSQSSLRLKRHGDYLSVTAPQFQFLSGRAVEKLRNGSTVTYILTLTVASERSKNPAFVLQKKFAVSFDLWEEKYSVVQKNPNGRSASRLNAAGAEQWCLESLPIPAGSVPERSPFMVRLECAIEDDAEKEKPENRPGLTLATLIDVLSRKKQEEPFRLEATAGPFVLEQLKQTK